MPYTSTFILQLNTDFCYYNIFIHLINRMLQWQWGRRFHHPSLQGGTLGLNGENKTRLPSHNIVLQIAGVKMCLLTLTQRGVDRDRAKSHIREHFVRFVHENCKYVRGIRGKGELSHIPSIPQKAHNTELVFNTEVIKLATPYS